MTLQDLKQLAHSGIEPQDPLNCAERAFFYAAKDIYAMFYDKRITQSESAERMSKIKQNYDADVQERQNGIEALQRIGEIFKSIEQSTTAFRKQYNEETALKVIECAEQILIAFYGATMRKDDYDENK